MKYIIIKKTPKKNSLTLKRIQEYGFLTETVFYYKLPSNDLTSKYKRGQEIELSFIVQDNSQSRSLK